jgi:DNA-binding response OmpR family regulator
MRLILRFLKDVRFKHVLLVEDDALVASGITAGLRLYGATVDQVETAQAARNALQAAHFEVG